MVDDDSIDISSENDRYGGFIFALSRLAQIDNSSSDAWKYAVISQPFLSTWLRHTREEPLEIGHHILLLGFLGRLIGVLSCFT